MEQGHVTEAEQVFREDLRFHPRNPWALIGLINVLKQKEGGCCSVSKEIEELDLQLTEQRAIEMADFEVKAACACCK